MAGCGLFWALSLLIAANTFAIATFLNLKLRDKATLLKWLFSGHLLLSYTEFIWRVPLSCGTFFGAVIGAAAGWALLGC